MLVTVEREPQYAPCSYLLVKENGDPYNEMDTILFQTDWDFPALASNLGYVPCDCGTTDGTVDCEHKTTVRMISEAAEFLDNKLGVPFDDPGYFGD